MHDLDLLIENKVLGAFKFSSEFSLSVGGLYKGKIVYQKNFGKEYKYYDLASMTKAIFTASYFLENKLENHKISSVLPWVLKSNLKISDLLSHQSGLRAHVKFYEELKEEPHNGRIWALKRKIRSALEVSEKVNSPIYSDLGYLVLGFCIEALENSTLEVAYQKFATEKKYPQGFHFNSLNKPKWEKKMYAPTERCKWRNRRLQGEVFDDNTHFIGGVAGQAGLFGSLSDMLEYGKILRKSFFKSPNKYKKKAKGWANGFMLPSGSETTAGCYFSKKSIGHLGYTGTSFWFDPEKDLFITILSNRTFPNREDASFNKFRPIIQNIIYERLIN